MNRPIFITALFAPFFVFAQDFQLRKKIDSSVLKIDSRRTKTISFTKTEKTLDNKTITCKYQFKYNQNQLEYASREYSDKDSSVKHEFYALASIIIFSAESISYYYGKDSVGWGGAYYFSGGILKDYETLGHGKSEDETWNPEAEVLGKYQRTKEAVINYRKKNIKTEYQHCRKP
jgi:hypothetical protein